ncbi:DUF5916 domain-containing protein [Sorangium sp. So ce429]
MLLASAPALAEPSPVPIDWNVPHGSHTYRPVRAEAAPVIDGVLDDAVWSRAPRVDRFASARSKPYGLPSTEPTVVQVAYDEEYLYIAFRCTYSKASERDDSVPADESTLFAESERVGILVDARLDHATARSFTVGRTGARGDLEITQNGAVINREWRGIWDAEAKGDERSWTAEFRIPWGTLGLPSHDDAFEVGVNFLRAEPNAPEYAFWALVPPASSGPPSFYGHLVGMSQVHPSQRLYLQPFIAAAVRQDTSAPLSGLRDFTGGGGNVGVYGGFYARYRPAGPLQIDATMNPDFSTATPDQAVANLDRFELNYPELRPFFAEDRPRFEFGVPDGPQLFYTRRLGIKKLDSGAYGEVPILYGAKGIVRENGTELAAMSVGMSTSDPKVTLADSATVVRLNHSFGDGNRLGNIFMARTGSVSDYLATGIDGQYTMFDQHLTLSGFYARSTTEGEGAGSIGSARLAWASQDFNAGASFLGVDEAFDPQLGFVPATGILSTTFHGAYTPLVTSDLIRQVLLEASVTRTTGLDDTRVYDRGTFGISAEALNRSLLAVRLMPSIEQVADDFKIAADRITIPAGRYNVLVAQISLDTPPRRVVEAHLGYTEGDLFGGYQRALNARLKVNRGRFSGSATYELTGLRYGGRRLVGHRISTSNTFTYTPLARTTLIVEANTLTLRSIAQLVSSYTFGELSTASLTFSGGTGQTTLNLGDGARWYDNASFSAVASFAYGFSPF